MAKKLKLDLQQLEDRTVPALFITEVAPWAANDWFEVTNDGNAAVDITGWKMDDESNNFGAGAALNGVTSIAAGESVVFIDTNNPGAVVPAFLNSWYGNNPPAGLQVGSYTGSGIGLGAGGDGVSLFDGGGTLRARVTFGSNQAGNPSVTFDNADKLNNTTIVQTSVIGVNGAAQAANANEVGSPGKIATPAPPAGTPTIEENTISGRVNLRQTVAGALSGVLDDPTDFARTVGIDFAIDDTDTPVDSLTVTFQSSNTAVVPAANIDLTGGGAARNLKITPAAVGKTDITVTVSDGAKSSKYVIRYAASANSSTPISTRWHTDASDASAAVQLDDGLVLVADDEDQKLRLYDPQNSGLPIKFFDVNGDLGLPEVREVDIEAAARVGNLIYWVASGSNSREGELRPNRNRIFVTEVAGAGPLTTLTFRGRYDFLRNDLIAWDQRADRPRPDGQPGSLPADFYGLAASANGVIPESGDRNGFNIEGVVFNPNNPNEAYIAFRAPQTPTGPRTHALIVPVTNFATLAMNNGAIGSAQFGDAIELDLGVRGIRDIVSNGNQIVIVAGAASSGPFALYTWTGNRADAPVLRAADLTGLNPEAIASVPANLSAASQLLLLSDNGDNVWYNDGVVAKELRDDQWTKFRSDVVTLGAAVPVARNGSKTTSEDTVTTGTLVATGGEGALTYSLVSTANAHGTVTITNAGTGEYSYTPAANFSGVASFTFKASSGGPDSNVATVTITVNAVNDAPTLTAPAKFFVTEDVARSLHGLYNLADVDAGSGNVTAALVVPFGKGKFNALSGGGVTVAGNNTRVLSLTGSVANIRAFLATVNRVRFTPLANNSADVVMTVTVSDNGRTGAGGAKSVARTVLLDHVAVNDAPVNVIRGRAVTARKNSTTPFTNTRQLRVDDVEARLGGTVQVTLEVLNGTARGRLLFSGSFGVRATGHNTAKLVLRGTLANINRALLRVAFRAPPAAGGSVVKMTTSDLGLSPAPAKTDADLITFSVTA